MFDFPFATRLNSRYFLLRSTRYALSALVIWLAMIVVLQPHPMRAADRPNIIVIMADDMGFSDIGCFGSEIETPNLDALAAGGVRLTQFYNTARCCPTRATLMTGLYAHQAGVGHMMGDYGIPGYRGDLNDRCVTIAEVLKSAGYATYMAGKWHVTPHTAPDGPKYNWPRQRGFDRFLGTIHGAGSFYDPNSLTRENTQIPPWDDFYYTDVINDTAAEYIREHHQRDHEQPFFIYVAHTAPHWPMHAKPEDIAKYEGRYDEGWDVMRQRRHEKLVKLGIIDPHWKLSPRDDRSPAWQDAPDKAWELRLMETFAGMVDCLDQGVGRIVEALKDTGEYDDTLIVFFADNGGCAEGMGRQNRVVYKDSDPRVLKPMAPDELQRNMIPQRTRDGRVVRQGRGVMAGPADTYIGYGLSWANASNTPFRLYKHWVHEGGISAPFIAHWPNGIERKGELESQPAHLIDIMATCVDLSGAEYPDQYRSKPIQPMEGVSLMPALRGQSLQRPNPLFWEHEGNRAIRRGKWKAVLKHPGPWELYDIQADRTELNNLADEKPELLEELVAAWQAWADRANVVPWQSWKKNR